MSNKTAELYEKILEYKRDNRIKELSDLAYSLVTDMSQVDNIQKDAGAIVEKSQLDTGLKEFREQMNIILTENPLMPLDEADKRLRNRMKDNAEQAVDMIEKIIKAIALTVAILKKKVGFLENQLVGFHLKKPNVLEANDIYVSGIEFQDIGDPSVGINPTNRLLKIDAYFDDQSSVKDFMVEIFDVWQKHVDGEPLNMVVIIFFGENHGIENGDYMFTKWEQITHKMDWNKFRMREPEQPPPPKPDHSKPIARSEEGV